MGILKDLRDLEPEIDKKTGLQETDDPIKKALEANTMLDVEQVEGESFMGLTRRGAADRKLFEDAQRGASKAYGTPDFVNPGVNIENDDLTDLAAFGQSSARKWGNGILKLAGKTSTAVAGGVGSLFTSMYGLGKYAFTDASAGESFKSVFDNEYMRGLDDLNEAMDYNLPNYIAKEERDLGFFKSLGTANFWANDFTNGLSFVAGAVLTEAALTAATAATLGAAAPAQAAATAGLLARAKKLFRLTGKSAKATDKMADVAELTRGGLTAAQKARAASKVMRQLVTGAGYEAGVEARHHLDQVEKTLTEDFVKENGRQPNDQELADIKDLATQSANSVFTANMALVGGGNMLQFPKIFGPGAGSAAKSFGKIVRNSADDALTAPYKAAYRELSKGKNILNATYHVLKNPFYEGFIEEGGQSWLSNASAHATAEYQSKGGRSYGYNSTIGLIQSLDDTFTETYGSKETQKEIGIGFILGALGLPTYAKSKDGGGKRKFEMQGGIAGALRARKEKRLRTDALVDAINKNPSLQVVLKNLKNNFENFSKATNLQQEMDAALAENNMFAYKNAENDQLFSYIDNRIKAGLYEHVIEDIEAVREMTNEQFEQEFGYAGMDMTQQELTDRKNKVVDSALKKAASIKKAHDQINNNPKFSNLRDEFKNQMIHAVSVAENVDIREQELKDKLNEIVGAPVDQTQESAESLVEGFTAPTIRAQVESISKELKEDEARPEGDPKKLTEERKVQLAARLIQLNSALETVGIDNTAEDAYVMDLFQKNNPKEFAKDDVREEVLSLLRDLRMLRARRQDFIGKYNALTTEEGQQESLQMIEYYMDDYNTEELERQRLETQKAISDNNKTNLYLANRDSEVEVTDDDGSRKYYRFLDPNTLYNVKDPEDKISTNVIMSGGVANPNVKILDSRAIERRRVREAVERIKKTDTTRLVEIEKEIQELEERLGKAAEVMREQMDRFKTRRDSKGRFVSIQSLENDLMLSESLYQELLERKEKLERDRADIQENAAFFDKMLKATESETALTLEEKLEFEARMKEEGLDLLGISGTTLNTDGTQTLITSRERLITEAQASITRSEQALQEIFDQISMLEDNIEKTKNYFHVLSDILAEDRALKLIENFKKDFPGVIPTYAAVTKYMNDKRAENPNLFWAKAVGADIEWFSPNLFDRLPEIEQAKKDQKFLEDELLVTGEKLEKLEATLRAAKQRESRVVDALDAKYRGMEKLQRAILFGRNYTALQKKLDAIITEEAQVEEKARGLKTQTPSPTSSNTVSVDGISKTPLIDESTEKETEETMYRPDALTIGYGKTAGVDKKDKFQDTSEENMSMSQRRFFKFIDDLNLSDIRNDRYEIVAFHRGTVEQAGLEESDINELNKDEFFTKSEETVDGIDIVLAIYDTKSKKYVRGTDGGLVYTKQMLPNEDGSKFSGITEENKAQFDAITQQFRDARNKVLMSRGPVRYRITGKGRGSANMQKDSQGNYTKGAALGRLTDSKDRLSKIKVEIATGPAVNESGETTVQVGGNKYKAFRGMPYALHKGYPVPLELRTLTDQEIETVYQILVDHSSKLHSLDSDVAATSNLIGDTDVEFRAYLNTLIGFGRRGDKNFEIFIKRENDITYLVFGKNRIDIRSLDPNSRPDVEIKTNPVTGEVQEIETSIYSEKNVQLLKEFLAKKNHNIDKSLLNKKVPYRAMIGTSAGFVSGKQYNSYNEYLFDQREDGETPPLTTGIVPLSEDVNNTQFKFTYLKYDYGQSVPQVEDSPTPQSDGPTDLEGGAQPDTGLDSNDMVVGEKYKVTVSDRSGKVIGTFDISKKADNTIFYGEDVSDTFKKIFEYTNAKIKEEGTTFKQAITELKAANPNIKATFEITEANVDPAPKVDATPAPNTTSVKESVIQESTQEQAAEKEYFEKLNKDRNIKGSIVNVLDENSYRTRIFKRGNLIRKDDIANVKVGDVIVAKNGTAYTVSEIIEKPDILGGRIIRAKTSGLGVDFTLMDGISFGEEVSNTVTRKEQAKPAPATEGKSIKRNFVDLENKITDFDTMYDGPARMLFSAPTVEMYEEVVGNYEFELNKMRAISEELPDVVRKEIESKLRDVKKSFTIIEPTKPAPTKPAAPTVKEVQSFSDLDNDILAQFGTLEDDPSLNSGAQDLLVSEVTEKYKKANIPAEVAWFEEKFPNIPIKVVDGLIDGKSYGRTLSAARVLLSDLAQEGTVYHEAYHVVSGRFTTPETKQEIEEAFTRLTGQTENIEEGLAEEFRAYMLVGDKYKIGNKTNKDSNFIKRFFKAIKDFFNTMLGRGPAKDRQRLQQFFDSIKNNRFVDPVNNPDFQMSMDKRITLSDGSKVNVNLSKDVTESLVRTMFAHLFNGGVPGLSMADLLDLSSSNNSDAKKQKVNELIKRTFGTFMGNLKRASEAATDPNIKADILNVAKMVLYNQDAVTKSVFDWLSQFSVDFEVQAQEEFTKFRDSYNVNENNETNVKDKAPAAVKLLIATLPGSRKNSNINSAYGYGLVDYKPFFNLVLKKLAGTHSFEDQINKLKELAVAHPEYADIEGVPGPITALISRLKANKDATSLTANEFKLQRQFRQQFHKFSSEDVIALYDGDTKQHTFIPANADREAALIMSEFRANFKEKAQRGSGPFSVDQETGRVVIDPKKSFKLATKSTTLEALVSKGAAISEADALAFLNYLGVEFTNPQTLSTRQRQDILNELLPSQGTGILTKLVELGNDNVTIEDIFSRESGAFNRFKKIIDIQADRTEKSVDLQFQTADGKTAYGIIINNFATNIIGRLNNGNIPEFFIDPTTGQLMESVQGSIFLDAALNGEQIGMGTLNGIKKEGNRRGFVYENNSPSARFIADFNATLDGYIPMIRPSEKKSQFMFNLNKRNDEGDAAIDRMPKTEDQYVTQMTKYLRQEIYKALSGHGANIDGYRLNKSGLRLFDYVESVNLEDIGGVANIDAYLEENKTAIETDLKAHLNSRTEELFRHAIKNKVLIVDPKNAIKYNASVSADILNKNNITFDKSGDYNSMNKAGAMLLVKRFAMLSEVGNIEQTITILGDVGFFKPDSYFKRTSGPHGPKLFADNSDNVNDWLNENYTRLDGKTADGKLRLITYRDVKASVTDDTFVEYATALGADPDAIRTKLESPETILDPKTEEVYEALRPYLEFDEGDAQGYMPIDEYMEFLERVGNVTTDQRNAYEKVRAGESLTSQEMAVFPALKPQYFGPSYQTGIYSPTFLKLSVLPVYPQLVDAIGKNSNLGKMLNDMTNKQVGISVFESGVKVGKAVGVDGNSNDFYNEQGDYSGIDENNVQELYYEYMGIQVETQAPVKTKVSRGSQNRALISSNAYEDGKVVNKEVAKLDKRLQVLENELIDAEFEGLKREFGLNETAEGYEISEDGYEKFVDVLRTEAERRDMSDAYLEGLEEFLAGDLKVLDILGNKPKIENLLYSLISNRTVNYKTFGGAKVQVSSAGIEIEQRTTYQDKHKYGANVEALKFYRKEGGKIKAMQVMLPHYFKELIGENVTIQKDGVYKDGEKIGGPELLEVYGFRVPTSALNSIEAIEIAGFLPQEAGDTIMVPSEIVVKAGSDFDIDKLSIFLPNYTYNRGENKLSVVPFLDDSNSTTTERMQALRTLDIKKYTTLARQVGLENSVVNSISNLNKEFKKLKEIEYRNFNNPEVQDISRQINELYIKRRSATRSQRDNIDIEIGSLEMARLAKVEDIDTGLPVAVQEIKDKINKEFEKIDSQIANAVDKQKIPLERQNSTQAIQNQILTNSRKITLNPDNYDQLIRPVGADRLKALAVRIRSLRGQSNEAPRFSDLMKFEYIQEMGERFLSGKKALGIAAVANTHQVKAQRAGLKVILKPDKEDRFYEVGMPSFEIKAVELPDGSIQFEIPVGGRKDVADQNYISEIIGEFINAFVDVAKDPFVFDINANLTTASTAIALLRVGVPARHVATFMAQDAIVDLVAEKSETPGARLSDLVESVQKRYETKRDNLSSMLKIETTDSENSYELPAMERMIELGAVAREYEKISNEKSPEEALKSLPVIVKSAGIKATGKDLLEYYNYQIGAVGRYVSHYTNLALPLNELSNAVTGDRSGLAPKNRMEARMQVMKLNQLKASNQFVNLDKYLEESFQESFENALEESSILFNSLFATDRIEDAQMIMDDLLLGVVNRRDISNEDKAAFAGIIENSMVNYILQTVRTEKNKELFKDASRLFQGTKDTPSLARRVMALKKKGVKSIILNELFPMLQTYDPVHPEFATENIKKFNKRLTSFERNALIEDMQILMESDPELGEDLVKFIIMQSGQQTSPISFMDLIPAQNYINVVEPILRKYLDGNVNLENFKEQFYKNNFYNPFVVPENKKMYIDEKVIEREQFTGKTEIPQRGEKEVRVRGRFALQRVGRTAPPAEFISVILPDPSLTDKDKKRLKLAGKRITIKKLFKLTQASRDKYGEYLKDIDKNPKYIKNPTMTYEQIPTLGNGMFLQEYGHPGLISIVNANNIMLDGKDHSSETIDENRIELRRGQQVVEGNIFNIEGTPIIPVDSKGEHRGGFAHTAKGKGLPISNTFRATKSIVSAPIKRDYESPVDFATFADTVGKIDEMLKKNSKITFLLPLIGLSPRDGGNQSEIDARMKTIKELLNTHSNLKLVIPESTNPALKPHLDAMRTYFKC